MREVAERAGVHKSTVSRVLSGKDPRWASPETAEAIRSAARDIGYFVDPWAASLRTQRTRTIGVLLPRLTDTVLAMIFEAIDTAATRSGYQVLVASTGDDRAEQRRRVKLLEGRRVDGFIITTARLTDQQYLDELQRRGVRFVLANRAVGSHPVVRGDDRQGGRQATRHLLAAGHRRIGVIAGGAYAATAADRTHGHRDALAEAGIAVDPWLIVESGPDVDDGVRGARRLLSLGSPPTAIFAVNDLIAVGAMAAIRETGLRIGADVAVVGYNDIPLASRLPVPLSSVRHPVEAIGELAMQRLLGLFEGEPLESVTLPVQVKVRASSLRP
ncbi:MAG: LacI family DNA-binding transcriptional regulator [Carbonactinosporaceae bacterium]